MYKILAADGISEKGIELLSGEFEVTVKDKISADELLATIGEYDALMVRSASKVTAQVIEKADKLKIIGRAGVGVDNIDIPAATKKGIIVINSPGGNTIAATEHTMAMMLALARNIPKANETTQQGEWNRKKYVGVELKGKTLGIIGMGRIGGNVARRAAAFEMNIIAYDPYMNEERAKDLGVASVALEEIFKTADFITVHMPLTPDTKGMIGAKELAMMKKTTRLINCARGGIIDEAALAEAVKNGTVAGATFDYTITTDGEFSMESGSAVISSGNGLTFYDTGFNGVSMDVAEGIKAALTGKPVTTAVNMPPVSGAAMKVISPYLTLAERLGCTVCSLAEGAIKSVEVTYNGDIVDVNTSLLTTAVIKGMLNPVMEQEVNYINAPSFAKERQIKITEVKEKETTSFKALITVKALSAGGQTVAAGTLFGEEGRIVRINKFRVDVDPHARIVICPHINRPGVIGKVGSIMGAANINISGMQVGKTEEQGTNLMVLSVDNDIPADVLAKVKEVDGIFGAKLVNFYAV